LNFYRPLQDLALVPLGLGLFPTLCLRFSFFL
jgi:hypothetical protein